MSKHVPKLIALDVDGTIMNKNYRISERVKKTISAATKKGVHVLIATGRMYSATVPIGIELNLTTPLIVYQGSMVKEFYKSDKTLLHYTLNKDLSLNLINDLRLKDVQINIYLDDKLYVEKSSPILDEYVTKRHVPFYQLKSFEDAKKLLPTKILVMHHDPVKINKIRDELKEKYSGKLNITKSTDYFCEFVNSKCSKAGAVSFVAQKYGIDQSEIMAIGDQDNDREMIEYAGIGVAMGNGDENLQKVADYVTDTVNNDGVALAIEKFVLD